MNCLFFLLAALLSNLLSTHPIPDEEFLLGKWECTGNTLVFMDKEGDTPSSKEVSTYLKGMGVTPDNCTLTFAKGNKCHFRKGKHSFNLNWSIHPTKKEFCSSIAFFSLTGYLVQENEHIILVYNRPDLFMMMQFLCNAEERKNIAPLGELLDCCDGLTIGMVFSKR